jgi:hypothetical protein
MTERERSVEAYFREQCRQAGLLCLKFVSPARNGVPDRLVIGGGRTVFVELKRPGGRPRRLQQAMHAKLRRYGADVHVIDSRDAVDEVVELLAPRESSA